MVSNRGKMERADRAKQFMPFDGLKGFREALTQKERIIVQKKELSEGKKAELDFKLSQIQRNDMITVEYFQEGEYIQVTGVVSRVDKASRFVKIVDTNIAFDDISIIILNREMQV